MLGMTPLRITRENIVRIFADIVMISLAYVLGLTIRFLHLISTGKLEESDDYQRVFWHYVNSFNDAIIVLIPICIVVFYLFGFYTYGRSYSSNRVLTIFQAVSFSYLIFGFFDYFFDGTLGVPRSSIIFAYVLTLGFLTAARIWSQIWTFVIRGEKRAMAKPNANRVKRVLVIGGAGYIGSALLPRLLNQGYEVCLLDLLFYGKDPIKKFIDHPRLEIVEADFRLIHKIVEAVQGCDAVIHLGGIVGDPACSLDEDLTIEINLAATRMIAEVAKGFGVSRFIFASTCSVYGAGDEVLNEQSKLNPVSLYAKSKIGSERILLQMADDKFSPTMLRFGTIFGLSGRTRFDLVVNILTAKAHWDKEMTVFGGDQWRPFCHVDDAAEAVFRALQSPIEVVDRQIFNVGSNSQNYTIEQVAEIIKKIVPEASIVSKGADGDRRNYRVDFAKIESVLEFKAKWSIEDGVNQILDAIRSGEISNYSDKRYSNFAFLKEMGTIQLVGNQERWARQLIEDINYEEHM